MPIGGGGLDEPTRFTSSFGKTIEIKTDTFIIAHTAKVSVETETLYERLWKEKLIAIHFPNGPPDERSLRPNTNAASGKLACFEYLNKHGGFIWAQFSGFQRATEERNRVRVGEVIPGSLDFIEVPWRFAPGREPAKHAGWANDMPTIMKTLKLRNVRDLLPQEAMGLRQSRPKQFTLSQWRAAGDRVRRLVQGEAPRQIWTNLDTPVQEALCAEFLRHPSRKDLPTLAFLLGRVGGSRAAVDIEGLDVKGNKLWGQVTNFALDDGDSQRKLRDLTRVDPAGTASLVYFCKGPVNQSSVKHAGRTIHIVTIEEVASWIASSGLWKHLPIT